METVSVSKLKDELSEYLNRAAYGGERIVVTSHDRPKAAVISVSDLELLEELEDAQAAREALAAYRSGETVPYEEFRAELIAEGLLDE
jgi:prevent-host-death family protein